MSAMLKRYGWILLYLCVLPATAQDYEACGPLTNAYGPIDYRIATPFQRKLVEGAHFTPTVERLQRGKTGIHPGGDIDYTLRAFPNHPRALQSMMRLAERENTARPRNSSWTIDCWFDRAIRFQDDDGQVRLLYATYLARQGKSKEAVDQLNEASVLLGDNDGNAQYNLGLAYTDLKQYDKALQHAHKAYALGFDLPGLRNKLQRAGKWQAPPPVAVAPAEAPPLPLPPPPPPPLPPEATPSAPSTTPPAAPEVPTTSTP